MKNPYQKTLDQLVSRALSMLNRNPLSSTYGCFDRNFWHYKTLVDFPCASFQQVILGLAKLYAEGGVGNPYRGSSVVGDAVRSGLLYWCKIQNRDGSVNEYYENDRSFCPTAYTTFAAACAFATARDLFSAEESELIIGKIRRGGQWLGTHRNPIVQNQMIASMMGLYWAWKVTGDPGLRQSFEERRAEILSAQDEEGWFTENGIADIGYSFKDLDLLAAYLADRPEDAEVRSAVEKLMGFVSHFMHPDGTAGGNYGSRCTQHVFPFALEFFASEGVKPADQVLSWFSKAFAEERGIHPAIVEDKYAMYFYFNSYVQAFLFREFGEAKVVLQGGEVGGLSADYPRTTYLKNAGIFRFNVDGFLGWVGCLEDSRQPSHLRSRGPQPKSRSR